MGKTFIAVGLVLIATACGNGKTEYDATGTFEATEVTVAAKASGELKALSIDEGASVKENQTVGTIDAFQLLQKQDELAAAGVQLEANAAAANSRRLDLQKQLASIAQQIVNAEHEQQRFEELVRDGAAPRKQLDDINNQVKVLQRQLEATRDQIRSNNASLEQQAKAIQAQRQGLEAQKRQVDDQIGNTRVQSPIAGTILEKYVEQGEFVTVGKPLFKVADTQQMFIRAYVTSTQLRGIKIGQKVKVMADYGDNQKKTYDGTIAWISSRSEFTPKTILTDDERADLVYAIKVRFKNDGYAKIGMYGEVKF